MEEMDHHPGGDALVHFCIVIVAPDLRRLQHSPLLAASQHQSEEAAPSSHAMEAWAACFFGPPPPPGAPLRRQDILPLKANLQVVSIAPSLPLPTPAYIAARKAQRTLAFPRRPSRKQRAAAAPPAPAAAPAPASFARLDQMARLIQRKYRGRSKQLQKQIRIALANLPAGAAAKACAEGLDGIAELVCEVLGTNVWQRAIMNAPNEWEEDHMHQAISDVLLQPGTSTWVWLLANPTFFERMLLAAYEAQSLKPSAPPTLPPTTPKSVAFASDVTPKRSSALKDRTL